MSLHSDTLFWFRANQSMLFLLYDACLHVAEKQQIPILVFGLTRPGLEPTIYRTRGEHTNHYATDMYQEKLRVSNKPMNSNVNENIAISLSTKIDTNHYNLIYTYHTFGSLSFSCLNLCKAMNPRWIMLGDWKKENIYI